MAAHRRGPWSQAEDNYLIRLVHSQGALNWVRVAQLIGSRSPKQCRERYHQNLKPSLNHEPISPEEGLQIERLVAEMGKRWAEIARRLDGRSDNAVKNWWNGSMNRRRRLVVRRRGVSPCPHQFHESSQPWTFSRPRPSLQHPILVEQSFSPNRGQMDMPLPSPSTSETSRAESVDAAPSLISDSGSMLSISPRALPSPNIELPPLNSVEQYTSRRPSLPVLRNTTVFVSEADSQGQTFSARLRSDPKFPTTPGFYTPLFRGAEPFPTDQRHSQYYGQRGQIAPAPAAPLCPHSQQQFGSPSEKQRCERDSRMNLSSLLA